MADRSSVADSTGGNGHAREICRAGRSVRGRHGTNLEKVEPIFLILSSENTNLLEVHLFSP
jgi:hypothetical protein